MNKLAYYILSATLLAVFFSSCSDDEKTTSAAATLSAIKATSHSLEFSITPQYAEKCAWMCYKKGENAPTAEEILNKGIPASHTETSVQKAIALEAETRYIIQAASIREGRHLLSAPLEMKTQPTYEADIPVVKLRLEKAQYRNDNDPGNGNYVIRLASGETDHNGFPATIGDVMIRLDLYNIADANDWNATLPSGEYHAGTEPAQATCWDIPTTNIFERIGPDPIKGVVFDDITEGSIIVQRKGDTYTIDLDVVTAGGEPFRGHFKGDIIFEKYEPASPSGSYLAFEEDQHVSFNTAKGRYYGSWFYLHADDLLLQFYRGTFNENGVQTSGYYLNLTTYMHKLIDYNIANPPLEEGEYKVFNFKGSNSGPKQIPMTVNIGEITEFWGEYYLDGSYLEKLDSKSGKRYVAILSSGTMIVTRQGDNYQIQFDFVSTDGHKVTGEFTGPIDMKNYNDNDAEHSTMPTKPMSNVPNNVQMVFCPELTEVEASFMGSYLYPGLNSWQINFHKDKTKYDMITTEFFTNAADGRNLVEGTYTIGHEFKPMYALPGMLPYSKKILYTWYGDMRTTDEHDITSVLGPIVSGTMTVSKEGNDYKFVFDYTDDAGNKIQGEWKGKVKIVDYPVN